MSVSRFVYGQQVSEKLVLKVYDELIDRLPKIFPLVQSHTPFAANDYIDAFIETEKYKNNLPECFGTFKTYLGDVPGSIILNYERPKFDDEVEAEKKALELAEKWRLEGEEYYKDRCRCCGRKFDTYENL